MRRLAVAIAMLFTAAAFAPAVVTGAKREIDRETFVKRADAICRPALNRATPLLEAGVRNLNEENWDAAAEKMVPGFRIFRGAFRKIRRLERPPADADRIRRWIDLNLRATRVGVDAIQALRREQFQRSVRLGERSLQIIRKSKHIVRYWGFIYC